MFQFTHPGKGATIIIGSNCTTKIVSIHAPWEGCDLISPRLLLLPSRFQFTHPGKGATGVSTAPAFRCMRFNSRTLGRVRRMNTCSSLTTIAQFQFTHPGKGATGDGEVQEDVSGKFQFTHPGKGATHSSRSMVLANKTFQFTHPGKGATVAEGIQRILRRVSIHAPWEGCDLPSSGLRRFKARFNSRTLGRVRLIPVSRSAIVDSFNSRTLGRVRHCVVYTLVCTLVFQFTHPGKGATLSRCIHISTQQFQFTHPGKGATSSHRPYSLPF